MGWSATLLPVQATLGDVAPSAVSWPGLLSLSCTLTCTNRSHHFSTYPGDSCSDVPPLCPQRHSPPRGPATVLPVTGLGPRPARSTRTNTLPEPRRTRALARSAACAVTYPRVTSREMAADHDRGKW